MPSDGRQLLNFVSNKVSRVVVVNRLVESYCCLMDSNVDSNTEVERHSSHHVRGALILWIKRRKPLVRAISLLKLDWIGRDEWNICGSSSRCIGWMLSSRNARREMYYWRSAQRLHYNRKLRKNILLVSVRPYYFMVTVWMHWLGYFVLISHSTLFSVMKIVGGSCCCTWVCADPFNTKIT